MKAMRDLWKRTDRLSVIVLSLAALLLLLLTGLLLADESLRRSTDIQGLLDATTSAKIVAQEVALVGERLHEIGTNSARIGKATIPHDLEYAEDSSGSLLRAVWLIDTTGTNVLDSVWIYGARASSLDITEIRSIARDVATSRRPQIRGLAGGDDHSRHGLALLGEPIVLDGAFQNIGIGLVDDRVLLASAGSTAVKGRSFLALLVDGDTVVQVPHKGREERGLSRVRVPLPGAPAWFVVSSQVPYQSTIRRAIWVIGSGGLVLLAIGLVRERRQTVKIAERSVELERLSAELLRANRMKSEFLANVSHELRTPLNAIVGFVDLLRDGSYGQLSERQQSPIDRVATSAARLRTLVDQVLDIAKIAAGRLDVHVETITLRPFLLNILSEIEPLVIEKRLTVKVETAPETLKVRSDPTHLRQIMINLLGNAVKYTNNGEIHIRAQADAIGPVFERIASTGQYAVFRADQPTSWIRIDVRDTGIGIAAADLERVFEEFQQVSTAGGQDTVVRGTGLGLTISKRLAGLLGGEVNVQSTLGQGSTFSLWLPVRSDPVR